jgi:hypothetical protein
MVYPAPKEVAPGTGVTFINPSGTHPGTIVSVESLKPLVIGVAVDMAIPRHSPPAIGHNDWDILPTKVLSKPAAFFLKKANGGWVEVKKVAKGWDKVKAGTGLVVGRREKLVDWGRYGD